MREEPRPLAEGGEEPRRPAARADTAPAAPATRLLHGGLTRRVVRALHQVHAELGVGFLESVYEAALATVLDEAGLHVRRQQALDVVFHGRVIGSFRADLVVDRTVLVELKVAKALTPVHAAQVLNYLKCSGLRVGLLANFGPRLEFRRFVS